MSKYVIKDGELYHWKYTKREWHNGKWRYYYDEEAVEKAVSKIGNAPPHYKPYLKPSTYINKKGFVDENGLFWEGDYETARQKKWKTLDAKEAIVNAEKARAQSQYNSSVKKKIDDVAEDVVSGATKIKNVASSTIDKGKKAVANILDGLADKLRK